VGASRRPDDADGFPTRDFGIDGAENSSPWYLKRWVLVLWGLAVAVLIATIIYGLAILARGNGGGTPAPTTHPSTTVSSQTTTTTPTPSTPPTTTTPSTETTIEPTPEPTSTTYPTQHPHHHWWRSNLPPLPPIPHF